MASDVTLRDVTAADLPILYEHQRDAEASAMAAVPSREWDAYLAHWTKSSPTRPSTNRSILFDGTGCWQPPLLQPFRQARGRLLAGQAYWGKGIATQALAALLAQITTRPLSPASPDTTLAHCASCKNAASSSSAKSTKRPAATCPEADLFVLRLGAGKGGVTQ